MSLRRALAVGLSIIAVDISARACTIFVLTDSDGTLFFNNEDYSNPTTRIWFVPAGPDHLGAVYVGFDDGWAQGGMNSEGLAFDWVAGAMEEISPAPVMRAARGNPSERMLESCRTVAEAMDFYRKHWEPSFATARIMVADKTGASVIIGAKKGRVEMESANSCRGFGYAGEMVAKKLRNPPRATLENGVEILRNALQKGEFATKYSNAFDLRSGEIIMHQLQERTEGVKLNLKEELDKGAHYYDIPRLAEQKAEPPKPLLASMKRFYLDEFSPVKEDKQPALTRKVQNAMEGKLQEADYSPKLWKILGPIKNEVERDLQKFGSLISVTAVAPQKSGGEYYYKAEFGKAMLLLKIRADAEGRIEGSSTEGLEWKPEPVLRIK